jgi:hypothetical protein
MKRLSTFAACLLAATSLPGSVKAGLCGTGDPNEDHDFQIGQDGTAAHKIVLMDDKGFCHLTGQPIELQPGDGLNDGFYVHQFPGWDATAGVPFPLMAGHELTLNRIHSTNDGFDMLDPFLGTPILESDGTAFQFPWNGQLEHEDVFYRVDANFAHPGDTFLVTMQLTDPSGLHSSSELFTLNFEVMPEPSTAMFAVLGLAILLRRRSGS